MYKFRRFWFLRDGEGNFCWQICYEGPRLHCGWGADPARIWFYWKRFESGRAILGLHSYLWWHSWHSGPSLKLNYWKKAKDE